VLCHGDVRLPGFAAVDGNSERGPAPAGSGEYPPNQKVKSRPHDPGKSANICHKAFDMNGKPAYKPGPHGRNAAATGAVVHQLAPDVL